MLWHNICISEWKTVKKFFEAIVKQNIVDIDAIKNRCVWKVNKAKYWEHENVEIIKTN